MCLFLAPYTLRDVIMTQLTLLYLYYRDELGRFVADRRSLTSLKMEGCSNLGSVVMTSSSLSTLWLSDLHSLSKTVITLSLLFQFEMSKFPPLKIFCWTSLCLFVSKFCRFSTALI